MPAEAFFFGIYIFYLASNISPHAHGPALFLRDASYTRTGFSRPQSARALVHTSRRTTIYFDGGWEKSRFRGESEGPAKYLPHFLGLGSL